MGGKRSREDIQIQHPFKYKPASTSADVPLLVAWKWVFPLGLESMAGGKPIQRMCMRPPACRTESWMERHPLPAAPHLRNSLADRSLPWICFQRFLNADNATTVHSKGTREENGGSGLMREEGEGLRTA